MLNRQTKSLAVVRSAGVVKTRVTELLRRYHPLSRELIELRHGATAPTVDVTASFPLAQPRSEPQALVGQQIDVDDEEDEVAADDEATALSRLSRSCFARRSNRRSQCNASAPECASR